MGKFLLLVLAAIAVWLLIKGLAKPRRPDKSGKAASSTPERMVQCAVCGVHMPESDSMQQDEKITCRTPRQCPHRQQP